MAKRVLGTQRENRKVDRHRVTSMRAVWIHGDGTRIEQIVVNLLTNWALNSRLGRSIRLQGAGGLYRVLLTRADSGIGIAPMYLPRIFASSSRTDCDRPGPGGLGIRPDTRQQLARASRRPASRHRARDGPRHTLTVRFAAIAAPATETERRLRRPPLAAQSSWRTITMLARCLRTYARVLAPYGAVAADGPSAIELLCSSSRTSPLSTSACRGWMATRSLAFSALPRRAGSAACRPSPATACQKTPTRARAAGFDAHLVKRCIRIV